MAVRLDADLDDLGAKFPKRFRRHLVGGAVGAIDDDAEAGEAQVLRQRALGEFDVAFLRAFNPRGAADAVGVDQQASSSRRRSDPRSAAPSRRRACSRPDRTA